MKKDKLQIELYPKIYQTYLNKEKELIIDFLKNSDSILDVGCGTGRLIPTLAKLVKKYVGVEINDEYLKIARQVSRKFKNTKTIKLNAENLSRKFNEDQFDKTIACWNTIGCLKNDKKSIKEISKVTKNKFFFTILPKGTLEKRIDYYNKLSIKYDIVDREKEIIKSKEWGLVRAYSKQDIKNLIQHTSFKIEKIKLINNIAFAVYLTK